MATHDPRQHGAVGDGQTLATHGVQAAIDAAHAAGGGTVEIPPGTWLIGTIFLRSGITLDLHPAARLLGSPRLEDYHAGTDGSHHDLTRWHLLVAEHADNITIRGGGMIDGNGPAFWEPVKDPADGIHTTVASEPDPLRADLIWIKANKLFRPSPMIQFADCRRIRLEGFTIANAAGWNLHCMRCDHVWVRGVSLDANLRGPNNDGFDIDGCRDVHITDCHLSCCDDAIVLKTSALSRSLERVTVTGCIIRSRCAALKLGAHESFFDMRHVVFANCVVYESNRVVALYSHNGAVYEDIAVSNIAYDTRAPLAFNRVVHIDLLNKDPSRPRGAIRQVSISQLVGSSDGRILLTAEPGALLEDIRLEGITIRYPVVDDPQAWPIDHGDGQYSPRNHQCRAARAAVCAENVRNLVLRDIILRWPATDADVVMAIPEPWRFALKGRNGSTDICGPERYRPSDRLPPMQVLWARGVSGWMDCPSASSSQEGLARVALIDSDLRMRDG